MFSDGVQSKPAVLLAETDPSTREHIKLALSPAYDVLEATCCQTAKAILRDRRPQLVMLSLGQEPSLVDGFAALAELHELLQLVQGVKLIVLTDTPDKALAGEAIRLGAWDYLSKPIDSQTLKVVVSQGVRLSGLEEEWRRSQRTPIGDGFCGIIGKSPAMRDVFEAIRRVAKLDVPVLITGESGVGKEIVARAIHALSPRALQSFIPIHCAAIPETLLEAELFGHERGAFTGATRQVKGHLEMAHRGTLLLDELSEISLAVQVKLLRFLQDQQVSRVGGREPVQLDVRVLAATNRRVQEAISAGFFREDLFYRLGVVEIFVPALRDRGDDLFLIAHDLVERYCRELQRPSKRLSPEAIEAMRAYSWPGNVRELENKLKRAVIMADAPVVRVRDLDLASPQGRKAVITTTLKEGRRGLEKDLIYRTLLKNRGNISKSAAELGVSRPTLHSLLTKHSIEAKILRKIGAFNPVS